MTDLEEMAIVLFFMAVAYFLGWMKGSGNL